MLFPIAFLTWLPKAVEFPSRLFFRASGQGMLDALDS